jgi:AraC-like DNA-binding protein/mannose-6-phosphate isomerase-like protein (cupin superfamily)
MTEQLLMRADAPACRSKNAGWIYSRPQIDGIAELGIFDGSQGLAPHFHDELQISFVLVGQRSFRMNDEIIVLSAGQCICIEAGVPHQSLAGSPDLSSFNAYLPQGDYDAAAMTADIEDLWKTTGRLDMLELAQIVLRHQRCFAETERAKPIPIRADGRESIGALARRSGQSRETFSRSFAQRYGMPPHAFRLASRLNRARDLLRKGEPVAAAAIETGFADQSHLGRLFRRAFGTTPGRYRADRQESKN